MKTETFQQFDFVSGKYEAVKGMAQAEKAAELWSFDADEWLAGKPIGYEFTADDLRLSVGVVAAGVNSNNAVGAWFSRMSKEGRIAWTGRYKRSVVVSRHANQNRIWRKCETERQHRSRMLDHAQNWRATNGQ